MTASLIALRKGSGEVKDKGVFVGKKEKRKKLVRKHLKDYC